MKKEQSKKKENASREMVWEPITNVLVVVFPVEADIHVLNSSDAIPI